MKHLLTVVTLLIALPQPKMLAQEKKSFLDHLTMPFEVGIATSVGEAFDPGLYFKTSVEYRSHKNCGWSVCAEYDEYQMHFQNFQFDGVNTTEGTVSAINLFAGGGYRMALTSFKDKDLFQVPKDKKRRDDAGVISLGAMLQPGIALSSVEKVNGTEPNYRLKTVWQANFAMKATLQLDYLFSEYFGIFIAEAYTQPFGHQLIPARDSGVFSTSIGFTSFF